MSTKSNDKRLDGHPLDVHEKTRMNLINPMVNWRAIMALMSLLYRQRELTVEMTRREFSERYAGQVLGVVWGFAHPVVVILVYLFIFSYVFQSRTDAIEGANQPNYAIYLLAGLVPWMGMAEALGKSTQVITSNSNLVKQVIFPLEILPIKVVVATFVNELILLLGVIIYAITLYGTVPPSFALLPVLLLFQFMQMLGLSMLLSTMGAYLRDLKDMIQVFCLINIYLMPVLYMPDWLPGPLRWLMYLNPFTYQTLCFQDVFYHRGIVHYEAWLIFLVMSFLILGVGSRLFARLRTYIGNFL